MKNLIPPVLTLACGTAFQSWGGIYDDFAFYGEPSTAIDTAPVLHSAILRTRSSSKSKIWDLHD
jgi:hypothetical protein